MESIGSMDSMDSMESMASMESMDAMKSMDSMESMDSMDSLDSMDCKDSMDSMDSKESIFLCSTTPVPPQQTPGEDGNHLQQAEAPRWGLLGCKQKPRGGHQQDTALTLAAGLSSAPEYRREGL